MANDIIPDLFKEGILPKKYKNCKLSFESFAGTVDWSCDWSGEFHNDYNSETTYTMATPFWDISDGIPVDTESYDAIDSDNNKINIMNDDFNGSFTLIKWKDGFENITMYAMWIRRFYLPQVYSVIEKHLDNFRHYED